MVRKVNTDVKDARSAGGFQASHPDAGSRDKAGKLRAADLVAEQVVFPDVPAVCGKAPGHARQLTGHHGDRRGYRSPASVYMVGATAPEFSREPQRFRKRCEIPC